jgi:hypothetical protein
VTLNHRRKEALQKPATCADFSSSVSSVFNLTTTTLVGHFYPTHSLQRGAKISLLCLISGLCLITAAAVAAADLPVFVPEQEHCCTAPTRPLLSSRNSTPPPQTLPFFSHISFTVSSQEPASRAFLFGLFSNHSRISRPISSSTPHLQQRTTMPNKNKGGYKP